MISSMIKQQKNKNSVVSSTLVKPIKLLLVDLMIASHIYLSEEGSDLKLADLYLILPSFIGVPLHSLQHGLDLLVGKDAVAVGVEGIEVLGKKLVHLCLGLGFAFLGGQSRPDIIFGFGLGFGDVLGLYASRCAVSH